MRALLIDYGRGNLHSVEKALQRVGFSVQISPEPNTTELASADVLVLPGVGAFGDAMNGLKERGWDREVREWLQQDRSFLAICLGFQLLFESSDESPGVPGFGWLKGKVVKFTDDVERIPHMGWNQVVPAAQSSIWNGWGEPSYFYHVHSFYPTGVDADVVSCKTCYGSPFVSGIQAGRACAFQFHPEKSQDAGLRLLESFRRNVCG